MAPFHLLIKPTGAACNLACRYCFYLPKSALYPSGTFRMSDEVLEAAVEQVLAAHPGPEVTIAWQGGEPTLMGLAFYQRAAAAIDRQRRPGQRVLQTMQTNGALIDAEWAAFLSAHGILVGLSMDGPPALHDAYRLDRGGHPTAARVLRAWELLSAAGADVNVLCAVHAANVREPLAVYRYFRDLGARYLQFIPIVEPTRAPGAGPHTVSARSVRPGQYGRFLAALFDAWVARDIGTVFVQAFDAALASWLGQPSLCIFSPSCGRAPVLEHNGDVYACDHFVAPAHRLGNILTDSLATLLESPALRAFGDAKERALPPGCQVCPVLFACRGECPRNRFVAAGNGAPDGNYLCRDYRHFFSHIAPVMDTMAELVLRGGDPRAVMPRAAAAADQLAARLAAAARNDPCPCGSGLKTKSCHGK